MSAKQTGPHTTVKGLRPWALLPRLARGFAGLSLIVLAACAADDWVNPNKTAAEVRGDQAICTQEAQQDSLSRAGRTRDYVAPPGGPTKGNLGMSPMEMRERNAVTQDFHGNYDRCMESRGYAKTNGKS